MEGVFSFHDRFGQFFVTIWHSDYWNFGLLSFRTIGSLDNWAFGLLPGFSDYWAYTVDTVDKSIIAI
jgi:hypothetical protein